MSSYAGMTLDETVDHAIGLADPETHAGREHAAIGGWLIELQHRRLAEELRSRMQCTRSARTRADMLPVEIAPGTSCLGVDVGDVVHEARAAVGEG